MDSLAHGRPPQGPPPEPDAHRRAALLLVESLIHGLIARGALSVREAVLIAEIALDTEAAIAEDAPPPTPPPSARTLLSSVMDSLKLDLPPDDPLGR